MPLVRLPPKAAKGPKNTKKLTKSNKRKREEDDFAALQERIKNFDLKSPPTLFAELPLTGQTKLGLDKAHFKTLTDIQKRAVPLALQGKDVLGAAKTGSGKTLAFLIPVLEALYRRKWTHLDGVGALIISPTRELATQIFEVLRKIGREHVFSAGLVIGGKHLREEQDALHRMNIVVCTPGRMLQHMDQTVGLNFDNLQMLVLDEADRILDMGFRRDVDAIIENLPKERQTLLFSATQTKNVKDLARLSLKDPEYVAVHESADSATPTTLEQFYMTIPLDEKLDTLFAFIRNHLTSKILVFASSCKQVRFIYETFRQLHIGIPLMHLHGKQKQTLRTDITAKFTSSKNCCLFATDVVARGLDFPSVDWVLQIDCPEDADTYIHRVGRTARFQKTGRALLFLCPSETTFITSRLEPKKIPITRVNAKASKKSTIKPQLQSLCFKDPELKYLGQKAFVSYARSISIQKDRETFDITKYPLEEFASSLGLPGAPRIRGLKSADLAASKARKNQPRALVQLETAPASDSDSDAEKPKTKAPEKVRTKYDRMVERQNHTVLGEHYNALHTATAEDDDEADFLTVKETQPSLPSDSESDEETPTLPLGPDGAALPLDSKRRLKLAASKKELAKLKPRGTKLIFNDVGEAESMYTLIDEEGFRADGDAAAQREAFLKKEEERRREEEVEDVKIMREKRRVKKEKRKLRDREGEFVPGDEDDEGVQFEGYVPAPEWSESESEVEVERSGKKRRLEQEAVGESLEDLERMAMGLLG